MIRAALKEDENSPYGLQDFHSENRKVVISLGPHLNLKLGINTSHRIIVGEPS